jgi:hypothetical protein
MFCDEDRRPYVSMSCQDDVARLLGGTLLFMDDVKQHLMMVKRTLATQFSTKSMMLMDSL